MTIIDDMLREDVGRTIIFEDVAKLLKRSPYSFFLGLLHREDQYIVHITFSILTKMAVFGNMKFQLIIETFLKKSNVSELPATS